MSPMAINQGEHEVRKLQSTGGSTFTVSLPRPWVIKYNLQARDSIRIDWRPSGALRLTPFEKLKERKHSVHFSTNKLPENGLHDHLMGAYISGVDTIKVSFKKGEKKKVSMQVRRFLRSTRGFEIYEETDTTIELMCLMNAGDMPLHASLNRMYLQVTSLIRDIVSVIEGEDQDYISDCEERENEVDALLYLIQRQVRVLLESHSVASGLNLSRTQALEYANLARSLERMMDHAYSLATIIQANPKVTSNMISNEPFESLIIWQESLKELMINIRTRDSFRIEEARTNLKEVQRLLIIHEEDLLSNHLKNKWTALDFTISESVRRLCAYARDFGEILLNMKIYSELIQSK